MDPSSAAACRPFATHSRSPAAPSCHCLTLPSLCLLQVSVNTVFIAPPKKLQKFPFAPIMRATLQADKLAACRSYQFLHLNAPLRLGAPLKHRFWSSESGPKVLRFLVSSQEGPGCWSSDHTLRAGSHASPLLFQVAGVRPGELTQFSPSHGITDRGPSWLEPGVLVLNLEMTSLRPA